MADVFTKKQRSDIMRQVKSTYNKSTELKLIAFFKKSNIKG
jgi:G:T-mismatch repair DNA endonuclease (very short patch repair protein)